MPRLWVTKDNPKTSESKSEIKRIYTPEVRVIRPETITHIPPGLYSCTCLEYNDISYINTLAASGALSLGNEAGTDRSVSGEFGGSTPHNISEYYAGGANVPSGTGSIPTSGAIDFSDFYSTSNVIYSFSSNECICVQACSSVCRYFCVKNTGNAVNCVCLTFYKGDLNHLYWKNSGGSNVCTCMCITLAPNAYWERYIVYGYYGSTSFCKYGCVSWYPWEGSSFGSLCKVCYVMRKI